MKEKEFIIKIIYFKDTGKFYTLKKVKRMCQILELSNSPYMYEVVGWIQELKDKGELPGLQSGKWDGLILVDCEEGYPCLILPAKESE